MKGKCICVDDYYVNFSDDYPTYKKGKYYEYTDHFFIRKKLHEGFNVEFSKGEYLFFRLEPEFSNMFYGAFNTHFKTLKDIRKEKINAINANKEGI